MDSEMLLKALASLLAGELTKANASPDAPIAGLPHVKAGGMHQKVNTANVSTVGLLTQPGGLFTVAGMEPDVITTHIRPMGLGTALPVFQSNIDDPRYGFITGFANVAGSEATNPCDDAPKGYMKGGTLTAQFGRVMRQTETVEIDRLLHQQRGASTNLRLMGEMLGSGNLSMSEMTQGQLLDLVVQAEMVGVGVQLERKLATMLWQGSTANNTSGGGYKEFPGLDNQIATAQVDAETNTAMASADSLIYDFNYNAVDGTVLDIIDYLSMMEFYLRDIATRTGLLPVTWAVVMRPELWFELSAVWPCRYLTHRCATDAGTNVAVVNDNVNVTMRDAMRNGMYIDINGNRYPVITDDGIFEHTNINNANVSAGSYASSICMIPLRIRGNFPVTYWEHIDYRGVNTQLGPLGAGARNAPFWTSDGRFLWVYRENGYCFDLQAKIEPRVVLRTPHLAGKVQNVKYSPLTHLRSSDATSPYWANGGVSLRSFAGVGSHVWT